MIKLERIHMLSRADKLKPMRDFVRNVAEKQGCCPENLDCVVMAINEGCMNVIQHAYNNQENEEIIVELWKDKEELIVKIFDFAENVDIGSIHSRDLDDIRPGGLGVHIINQVMDSVEYKNNSSGTGNILEMRKQLNNPVVCCIDEQSKK